jgi:hypothetical protein
VELTLIRRAYLREATLGILRVAGKRFATLEEGWRADPHGPGGQRREGSLTESCVPDGTYALRPHTSAKYPQGVYALINESLGVWYQDRPHGQTWGRQAILIHSGNTVADIEGCILVGVMHGMMNGQAAVLNSRDALASLKTLLGSERHTLVIRPTFGTSEELSA